jgi:hypothetical protein
MRYDQPNSSFWDSGARYDEPDNLNRPIRPTSMIKLSRFLDVPFDDPQISANEMGAFSTDSLQRMIANNPGGIFSARITATSNALTVFENSQSSDEIKLGIRKARKMVKKAFRDALPEEAGRLQSIIAAKYGINSPEVTEAFPLGRTIFSTSTDDSMKSHLQTIVSAIETHVADLGQAALDDANALLTSWNAIHAASEAATGAKTTTQQEKQAARDALALELFKNLLLIAQTYPRQPEMLALYMQQSLLEDHPAEEPETPTPPPPTP